MSECFDVKTELKTELEVHVGRTRGMWLYVGGIWEKCLLVGNIYSILAMIVESPGDF